MLNLVFQNSIPKVWLRRETKCIQDIDKNPNSSGTLRNAATMVAGLQHETYKTN